VSARQIATAARPHAPRLVVPVVLALLGASACSGSGGVQPHRSTPVSPAGRPAGAAADPSRALAFPAKRWWSNAAVTSGSQVDPAHPGAAAAALHSSRAQYCTMLRQTTVAGKTIFTGVAGSDRGLQATIRAFVAEITAVAPGSLRGQWHTLGTAIVTVATSGGELDAVSAAPVQRAASSIAADAAAHCGLTLAP
jgi:hypothetical protein